MNEKLKVVITLTFCHLKLIEITLLWEIFSILPSTFRSGLHVKDQQPPMLSVSLLWISLMLVKILFTFGLIAVDKLSLHVCPLKKSKQYKNMDAKQVDSWVEEISNSLQLTFNQLFFSSADFLPQLSWICLKMCPVKNSVKLRVS